MTPHWVSRALRASMTAAWVISGALTGVGAAPRRAFVVSRAWAKTAVALDSRSRAAPRASRSVAMRLLPGCFRRGKVDGDAFGDEIAQSLVAVLDRAVARTLEVLDAVSEVVEGGGVIGSDADLGQRGVHIVTGLDADAAQQIDVAGRSGWRRPVRTPDRPG